MQGVYGIHYCLSENIQYFLPCIFIFFILVYKTVISILTTCKFWQHLDLVQLHMFTVLNCLSMKPSSLLPRSAISSHLKLNWLEPFFACVQPEVNSSAYSAILILQLFRSESEWCVISHLYACVSFLLTPMYRQPGNRKVLLLLLNSNLRTEIWILPVFCDPMSCTLIFSFSSADMNQKILEYFIQYKKP